MDTPDHSSPSPQLAPFMYQARPQKLTEDALLVAINFALEIHDPGLRLGYNSLGALASVNHLHFQFWHYDGFEGVPDKLLPLERCLLQPITSTSPVSTFLVQGHPVRSVAFSVDANEPEEAARAVHRCARYMLLHQIPHSLIIRGDMVYLFPRKKAHLPPFAALPGFPEVSGLLIMLREDDFESVSAELVKKTWEEQVSLDNRAFRRLVANCVVSPIVEEQPQRIAK